MTPKCTIRDQITNTRTLLACTRINPKLQTKTKKTKTKTKIHQKKQKGERERDLLLTYEKNMD